MAERMWPSSALERLDICSSYLAFKRFSVTGQSPVNMIIPAPKIRALQMNP
jgi:hypothetical protein